MPYKKNGVGNWRIKFNFKTVAGVEIGKLDLPMDTKVESEAKAFEASLKSLRHLGEHGAQLLCDFRDRNRTASEIHRLIQTQAVRTVPVVLSADSLRDAWLNQLETGWRRMSGELIAPQTRAEYRYFLSLLLEREPTARVRDLPRLLEACRDRLIAQSPRRANTIRKVKAACQSFARNYEARKKFSDLWRMVSEVTVPEAVETNGNKGLRVYEVRELIEAIPDERIRHVCWGMALTGMSIGEYVRDFEVHEDHVLIHGAKNQLRVRRVPLLADIVPQPVSYHEKEVGRLHNSLPGPHIPYETINAAVNKASGQRWSTNVFRHSYAVWLQNCGGIPEDRQDKYRGHKGAGHTRIRKVYTDTELHTFLHEDTERLLAYIRKEWDRPKEERRVIQRLDLSA